MSPTETTGTAQDYESHFESRSEVLVVDAPCHGLSLGALTPFAPPVRLHVHHGLSAMGLQPSQETTNNQLRHENKVALGV